MSTSRVWPTLLIVGTALISSAMAAPTPPTLSRPDTGSGSQAATPSMLAPGKAR